MKQNEVSWKYRRRYVLSVTAFICCFMIYSVERLGDVATTATVVSTGMTTLAAIVGSYVFGAVWDHKNARGGNNAPPS